MIIMLVLKAMNRMCLLKGPTIKDVSIYSRCPELHICSETMKSGVGSLHPNIVLIDNDLSDSMMDLIIDKARINHAQIFKRMEY